MAGFALERWQCRSRQNGLATGLDMRSEEKIWQPRRKEKISDFCEVK